MHMHMLPGVDGTAAQRWLCPLMNHATMRHSDGGVLARRRAALLLVCGCCSEHVPNRQQHLLQGNARSITGVTSAGVNLTQ